MATTTITLRRGESRTINLTVTELPAGTAVDLTGASLYLAVREPDALGNADEDGDLLFSLSTADAAEILVTDAAGGLAACYIKPAHTLLLTAGSVYWWDVWLVDANGDRYTIVPASRLVVGERIKVLP